MIESLWSCLLILALLNRETRPLAFVLGVKAVLNYAAAWDGLWLMPPLIDTAAGALGVVLAARLHNTVLGGFLAATFVIAPMAHAWHWGLWVNEIYVGVQYWVVMLGLFSAQVFALALPEVRDIARAIRHDRGFSRRRSVAALADSAGGQRASGSKE